MVPPKQKLGSKNGEQPRKITRSVSQALKTDLKNLAPVEDPIEAATPNPALQRNKRKTRNKEPMYGGARINLRRDSPETKQMGFSTPGPKTTRKSKIPATISFSKIPSPARLKVKSALGSSMKTRNNKTTVIKEEEVDDLVGGLESLALDTKKGVVTKGKTRVLVEEMGGGGHGNKMEAQKNSFIEPATGPVSGRTRNCSDIGKLPVEENNSQNDSQDESEGESEDDYAGIELSPFVPASLRQNPSKPAPRRLTSHQAYTPPKSNDDIESEASESSLEEREAMLELVEQIKKQATSFFRKSLQDINQDDVNQFEQSIEHIKADSTMDGRAEGLIKGMMEVVEKFWGFRDALEKFLSVADRAGLGLEWGRTDKSEDGEELDSLSVDGEEWEGSS